MGGYVADVTGAQTPEAFFYVSSGSPVITCLDTYMYFDTENKIKFSYFHEENGE